VLTPHPNNNNNNYRILYEMTEENVPGSKYVNVLADNNNPKVRSAIMKDMSKDT
jgi:hypothetical protein